jgi:hypothetical protein
MPVTRADVQNGAKLDTPQGGRTVGGRVATDGGAFVVLVDEDGVGSLVNEGTLYDNEDVSVAEEESTEKTGTTDTGKGDSEESGKSSNPSTPTPRKR